MKTLPAVIVATHRLVNQYHVIARIGAANYRGSFATLVFGDNKPFIGACHDRRLDLIYLQHPNRAAYRVPITPAPYTRIFITSHHDPHHRPGPRRA